ncbi:MAG: Rrf2 family transcriptional regulator [Emcibacteraceae bacterium]
MRLTSFTDYSVRVLMHVAKKNGALSSIREVSEEYDISKNHLMKIVHALGKGGYLETVRGKNGGFKLGQDARNINIGELIRYTEEDMKIVDCLGVKDGFCTIHNKCHFACIINEARNAFLSTIDKYTLEDIVNERRQMQLS